MADDPRVSMPTSEQSLICPACSTRLRVGVAEAPPTGFDCPDCSASLVLNKQDSGELSVSVADTPAPPVSQAMKPLPKLVAAGVTVVAAILVLVVALTGGSDESDVAADQVPQSESVAQTPESRPDEPPVTPLPDEDEVVTEPLPEPVIEVAVAEPEIDIRPPAADEPATRIPVDPAEEPEAADLADTPILPELSPDEPVDIQPILPPFADRIAITISSFDQSKPTPLSSVIEVVEQLTQVSINTDAVPVELLSKPVSFAVEEATPVEILSEAIRQSGLKIDVDEQAEALELVPAE